MWLSVTSEPVCNLCLSRATVIIAKNIILACPISKNPQILFHCGLSSVLLWLKESSLLSLWNCLKGKFMFLWRGSTPSACCRSLWTLVWRQVSSCTEVTGWTFCPFLFPSHQQCNKMIPGLCAFLFVGFLFLFFIVSFLDPRFIFSFMTRMWLSVLLFRISLFYTCLMYSSFCSES